MRTAVSRAALALFVATGPCTAFAGEIIGSNYISETDGVIEIAAEGWTIMDTEKAPIFPNQFARFSVQRPLGGSELRPHADFFRLANPGGAVQAEAFLREIGEGMAKVPGMSVSPIEARQFAGRQVLALPASMTVKGGSSRGVIYLMKGEKSLYWAQLFAPAAMWEEARAAFDRLMENVKY